MTLSFVSREEAGLQPPAFSPLSLPWEGIDELVVHYTGSDADRTGDPLERWRGVQRFHQDVRGWNDIGYSFGFTDAGVVLEGRGWNVVPAATLGVNHRSQAFVFLGADRDGRNDVTALGRRALGRLILEAERLKGAQLRVSGHSDHNNTACPGDELRAYIALRGWVQEVTWPKPLPRWTWRWMAWRLGEGDFRPYGPSNRTVRHLTGAPRLIPPWAWRRLRALLRARSEAA